MELRDTLLLVNDIPRCRAALQRMFEPNYNLLEAENGAQALALLEQNHRHIAAVLLDTAMPVKNGYEVLSAMASNGLLTELPVIVVTDDPDPQLESRAFDLGASEVIHTPCPMDSLQRRVKNIIAINRRRWQLEKLLQQQSPIPSAPVPAAAEQTIQKPAPVSRSILLPQPGATQTEQELRASLHRLEIIMEQSDDIVFEWDIPSDTVNFSHKWKRLFGYDPPCQQLTEYLTTSSHVHPQDISLLVGRMAALRQGTDYQDTEIRIANSSGRYLWCRLRASLQRDAHGQPQKVVGIIINIDAEKRANRALRDKAEQDSLTKLLNKNTSRTQVEQRLQNRLESECCALLMFDLDNFKQINDQHGHLFGDTVLTQVAAQLRRFFRSEDVIARVGGDEFMVFMSNIPDRDLVERRCSGLINAFSALFHERLGEHGLSCSIGAAVAPEHGLTFQELFQKADLALYHAKSRGKNCFSFYDSASRTFPTQGDARPHSPVQPFPAVGDMVSRAFPLLSQASDVEKAVHSILEMAGRQMKVSRVYLYETSPDGQCYNLTFEWCAQGVLPLTDEMRRLTFDALTPSFSEYFDERGVFCCSDIATLPRELYSILSAQSVRSMAQFAMYDRGLIHGFVGFDEHNTKRIWRQEQIDTLLTLTQILSVFLFKQRSQF